MCTERDKMLRGEMYDAFSPDLVEARCRAQLLCRNLNQTDPEDLPKRQQLMSELFGKLGKSVVLEPPFFCDYGNQITLGDGVYINFNCTILDPAEVVIGDNTMIGPSVQIYTASHPLEATERMSGKESAHRIEIGETVWIGGGAIICPGVKIGDRTVIGAGSVVTKDIPSDVVAAGNPCKVIRNLKKLDG